VSPVGLDDLINELQSKDPDLARRLREELETRGLKNQELPNCSFDADRYSLEERSDEFKAMLQRLGHLMDKEYFFYRRGIDGVFTEVSDSVTDVLGYTRDDFLKDYSCLLPDCDKTREGKRFTELCLQGIRQPPYEIEIRHKDGRLRTLVVSEYPVREGSGFVVAVEGMAHDVTQIKELEDKLAREDRDAALGRIAGGVAHEFNNLLQVVNGNAELIGGSVQDSASKEMVDDILSAGRKGASLVMKIMEYARKTIYRSRPVDMHSVVQDVVNSLKLEERSGVSLDLGLHARYSMVLGDCAALSRSLESVLKNAHESMPDGGKISIRTSSVRIDGAPGQDLEISPGDYLEIAVTDTGCGMDSDVRGHLFEPFYTTKSMANATGLSLAAAYGAIKRHNGAIVARSEVGKGSDFKFYLPLFGARKDADSPSSSASGSASGVLVIDDECSVRGLACRIVEKAGYTPTQAASGPEGIELYHQSQNNGSPIGVVILDLTMPGMSGVRTMEEIIGLDPHSKFIICSGYSESLEGNALDRVNIVGKLQKPYSIVQLMDLVKQAMGYKG